MSKNLKGGHPVDEFVHKHFTPVGEKTKAKRWNIWGTSLDKNKNIFISPNYLYFLKNIWQIEENIHYSHQISNSHWNRYFPRNHYFSWNLYFSQNPYFPWNPYFPRNSYFHWNPYFHQKPYFHWNPYFQHAVVCNAVQCRAVVCSSVQ